MSDLERMTPGQSIDGIPGRTWNAFVDGEIRDRAKGPPNIRGPQGTAQAQPPNPARVMVKNGSENDVPTGGVLTLSDVLFNPADRGGPEYSGPVFLADIPEADNDSQTVVIAWEPIKVNAVGQATLAGCAFCKLLINAEGHTFAKPKASVDELESDASTGFPIIWKETGTGADKWAVVSLTKKNTINVIHGQAVGAMSGSGAHDLDNIEVMNGSDPREDPEDTAETVEVLNPFEYTADDNGLVRAEQADNGDWIVTDAKCPA
jgi:hypothetical protein